VLNKVIENILNPFVNLLIGVAVIVFLWGLVEFVAKADNPEGRETGQKHLLWGIVGLAIILGAVGILKIVQSTVLGLFP